ncbi:TetR/AcrR family transcriptional regulator [Tepidiphilus margaritifer]|uniref:TetR/AcrR family transcriptional regulator n=1 Tax=Tepidiphilus margaritifer TaxID=203471 RepID=UPI0004228074|nr:TetR/AcrR family transcriptional regulator [Tepidiphilus margaritifer]
MARRRGESFEQQRNEILEKAAMLFAEAGFHAASMASLAQACGVSKALLYHYYQDKEHILFDVALSYVERLVAIVEEELGREPPLGPAGAGVVLDRLIARFLEEYRHSQYRHIVLVQDVKHLPEPLREPVLEKQRQVVRAFAGVIAALEPELAATALLKPVTMVLFGMINWTFTWLRPDGPLSYRDMAPIVTTMFMAGVHALVKREDLLQRFAIESKPVRDPDEAVVPTLQGEKG